MDIKHYDETITPANVADVINLSNSENDMKQLIKDLFEPWRCVRLIDTVLGFSLAVALYVFLLIASLFN